MSLGDAARSGACSQGLTLIELLIAAAVIVVGITALLGSLLSQATLTEYHRNLTWAIGDASRVVERLRQQNTSPTCTTTPLVNQPAGFASWDAWLASTAANGGQGKSIQPDPAVNEWVAVTPSGGANPRTVTVAVCWRHRGRVFGDCDWIGGALVTNPGLTGDPLIVESPAMLSTLVSCR